MGSRPLEEVPDGRSIFVDTNILIYHLLEDELYGASCRNFLRRVENRSVTAFTSPIVAAETLFIYLRAWVVKNKKVVCQISSRLAVITLDPRAGLNIRMPHPHSSRIRMISRLAQFSGKPSIIAR